MFRFRPFRNSDPPALVNIWQNQPPLRGRMQPMSVALLDHFLLSKPYFDRHGLIIAEQDGAPAAFVHAGFGPDADRAEISTEAGVICMMLARPEVDSPELRRDLLGAAEQYLRDRGAATFWGGEFAPRTPFYRGLYGGSDLPGVLESDEGLSRALQDAGYESGARCVLMSCQLSRLRLPFDRRQRQLNRLYYVDAKLDHQFHNWWDNCTIGQTQYTCFRIVLRGDRSDCGSAIFWDLEPLASGWGVQAVGLNRLRIPEALRREGLATLLISHALKKLQGSGVSLVQTQIPADHEAGRNLFRKLGFEEVDRGVSFRKAAG